MTGSPTFVNAADTVQLAVSVGTLVGSSYTYAPLVLINTSRSYSKKANMGETVIPRTDDPTQPGQIKRVTTSVDTTISGAGTSDHTAAQYLESQVGQIMQLQIVFGADAAGSTPAGPVTGDLVVTGPYVLEEFTLTGSEHGKAVESQIKFSQAGVITSSAHS